MTPPPVLEERNFSGSPIIPTSQSKTWVSSSVHAGLVAQSMPCTPSPADNNSPRMDGPETADEKYAKKLGDCQCVIPGRISFSTSPIMFSNDSPTDGGCGGRDARICPGSTCDSTGNDSTRE